MLSFISFHGHDVSSSNRTVTKRGAKMFFFYRNFRILHKKPLFQPLSPIPSMSLWFMISSWLLLMHTCIYYRHIRNYMNHIASSFRKQREIKADAHCTFSSPFIFMWVCGRGWVLCSPRLHETHYVANSNLKLLIALSPPLKWLGLWVSAPSFPLLI